MPPEGESHRRPRIAFGPELLGIGSWEWVGEAMMRQLATDYEVVAYRPENIPKCDVLVIVKYNLPTATVLCAAEHAAIVYCPVDYYGSPAQIDADARILSRCSQIIIHNHRLQKYFQSYAPTTYLDHHVRFVPAQPVSFRSEGYVLWVGMRTHLPILAEWVNAHTLSSELRVLTNLDQPEAEPNAAHFGFDLSKNRVRMSAWSRERHLEWVAGAHCALDIKGDDFRQRHKPPTKAIDFIASGLPLAMNSESSSVEYLAGLGFDIASPDDQNRWLSQEYFEETSRFGARLRESFSERAIGVRFREIIEGILAQRQNECLERVAVEAG